MSAESGKAERRDGSIYYWADSQSRRDSLFQEKKTVELSNQIELKSVYGLSKLRDVPSSTGSGSVTHTGPEYKLSVSASTGDRAELASAERGRYIPGHAAEAGIGVRAGTSAGTNNTYRFGFYDDDNGFFIGQDGQGWFVGRRSGSTDTVIRSSDWNGDTLDGEGPSEIDHSITDGAVYQVDFSWYGYGSIEYKAFPATTDNYQRSVVLHREKVTGSVSVDNPNLPIRAEVENNSSAAARDLYVGGRKYAIVGRNDPNFRESGVEVTGVSLTTSYQPVFSVRRKASVTDGPQWEAVSVKLADRNIVISSTDAVAIKVETNTDPSSTSWGALPGVSTGETALEWVEGSTSSTGGEFLERSIVPSGGKKGQGGGPEAAINFDFRRRQPVTVFARGIGSGSTMHLAFMFREEW